MRFILATGNVGVGVLTALDTLRPLWDSSQKSNDFVAVWVYGGTVAYGLLTACCYATFAIASLDLYRAALGLRAELQG